MMHGNWPDHNTFSKFLLDWTDPVILGGEPSDSAEILFPAGSNQSRNTVMIMPGLDPGSWSEFYLAENRAPGYGNDPGPWTKKGLTIWHVDATLDPVTRNFKYDNSFTSHKLLRIMEADGKEDIENNRGWDQNDIYGPDQSFGPATTPGSYRYDGTDSHVHILEIGILPGDAVRGRYVTGLTIPSPWVRVTVPQGGEQWQVGTPHTVTWTQEGLDTSDVRIDLWNGSDGKFLRSIAVSVPAIQGMYEWNIPADITPSADYRVSISSLRYPVVNDSSDGLVEITPVHQPAVSVKKYIARNNASWNDTSADVYRGAKVYYKVMVKNTGDCMLTSVSFADGSSYATYSMLEPGAAWTLYYSADAGASDYTNTAIVGAASPWGYAPSVRDSARYHLVPGPLPGFSNPPTDPDVDGIYEDLNANGRLDFADVVLYFNQMEWIAAHEPVNAFDLNANGRIDFADIVMLFGEI
jgi:PKD repeat protein